MTLLSEVQRAQLYLCFVIASCSLLACDRSAVHADVAVVSAEVAALEHDLKLEVGDEFEGPPVLTLLRADQGVLALDSKTLQLHTFDANGAPSGSSGRRGAGPGEFLAVSDMFRWAKDTVITYDPIQYRLTYFDSLGAYLGTASLVGWPASRLLRVVGRHPNGEIIGLLTTMAFPTNATSSIVLDSATLLMGHRSGTPRRLLQLPVTRVVHVSDAGNPVRIVNPLQLPRAFTICSNGIILVQDTIAAVVDFDGRVLHSHVLSVLGPKMSVRARAGRIAEAVRFINSASARREATAMLTHENIGPQRWGTFVLTDASGALWYRVQATSPIFARYATDGTRTAIIKLNAPRFLLASNDSLMLALRPETDSGVGLELLRLPATRSVKPPAANILACGRTIQF